MGSRRLSSMWLWKADQSILENTGTSLWGGGRGYGGEKIGVCDER